MMTLALQSVWPLLAAAILAASGAADVRGFDLDPDVNWAQQPPAASLAAQHKISLSLSAPLAPAQEQPFTSADARIHFDWSLDQPPIEYPTPKPLNNADLLTLTSTSITPPRSTAVPASLFRPGGRAELFDGITVEGGLEEMDVNRRSARGSVNVIGAGSRATASMMDVSMMLDTLRSGGLAFQLVGGMRATAIDSAQMNDSGALLSPLAVAGVGLSYDISDRATIRAVSVGGGAGGASLRGGSDLRTSYLEYRIESALRLSNSTSLSIGYQRFDSTFDQPTLQTSAKRDALLIELKLGF